MEIIYATCVRRKPNEKYYEKKFKDFKAERIYVSEFPPCSKRNGGYDARYFWSPATEDQAMRFEGQVFFKNASFYGCSIYYIKDRGGR
jgi:hypothetical protein